MKKRTLSSRAFLIAVLSLSTDSLLWADPAVTAPSAAPAQPAPVTPVANIVTPGAANPTPALTPFPYTVAHGDSLASIAEKFGLTVKELKRLNNLPTTRVAIKPGEVLEVVNGPHAASAKKSALAAKKKKAKSTTQVAASTGSTGPSVPPEYTAAQPAQNFDLSAGSHPSAPATAKPEEHGDSSSTSAATAITPSSAPVAKLVSPEELARDEAQQEKEMEAKIANASQVQPDEIIARPMTPVVGTKHAPKAKPVIAATPPPAPATAPAHPPATTVATAPVPAPAPAPLITPQLPKRSLFDRLFSSHDNSTAAEDWGAKFLQQARALGSQAIGYDDDWRPPGEARSWAMDCSNTARYLYKVTAGIDLPRTASDQYYYLHLQGKAWDVPQGPDGYADANFLRRNLKPGDLLFWENTYRPERQPPITHVMIFLGTNDKGQWLMAGSQSSRGGEHNRRDGGPDVYVFRPSQPCGGYTTWLGLVHHHGRFCAFGRPLEADRSKLSVADD